MSSSLIGFYQEDIKKIIAYSTMSQLGMMVLAIGLSSYNVSLFHLINHAFYKALLFLGAGSVIHAVADNQDLRKYGGLKIFLPLTYTVMLIASLSLIALPFMSGFYSKDFILESSYGQFFYSSKIIYFLALIGATFTLLYSIKILYLTFISTPNGYMTDYKKAHEGDLYMIIPLILLAIFSIFFGYVSKDLFIGLGSDFFSDNSIFIHPIHEIMLQTEFSLPFSIKILPIIITLVSFFYFNGYVNKVFLFIFLPSYIIIPEFYIFLVNSIITNLNLVIILSMFIFLIYGNRYKFLVVFYNNT
jgi:NADH-ubiquinone oxidoreductase chain 5